MPPDTQKDDGNPASATTVGTKPIRAVIFDLDGTLLDTETLSCSAVLDAFGPSLSESMRDKLRREEGYKLPWEIKKQTLGLQGHAWIPLVIEYGREHWGVRVEQEGGQDDGSSSDQQQKLPSAPSVSEFWEVWEARLSELCKDVAECPGATKLVESLAKRNIPLAIATSSREAAVQKKRIKHEKMFQHIPIIVCGDDPAIKNGKPAPDMYIEAARRLDLDPSDCLVFEDATAGVQSAKAAGCRCIAVPDPRMEADAFVEAEADEVIRSMECFDFKKWGLE